MNFMYLEGIAEAKEQEIANSREFINQENISHAGVMHREDSAGSLLVIGVPVALAGAVVLYRVGSYVSSFVNKCIKYVVGRSHWDEYS